MADINSNLPVFDTSDGTPGSAVPSFAQQVAGTDGTNLRTLAVDSTGKLNINSIRPSSFITGNLTALNSFVSVIIPEGQSSWNVYLSGTFSSTSQVAFEGSPDNINWFYLNGRRNTDSLTNDTTTFLDVTPMGGPGPIGANPSNWRGNLSSVKYFRVRCTVYTAADNINVQISTSAGVGAVFINAALPLSADRLGSGTINVINGSVSAATSGAASVVFSVTGTWVGTIYFQGLNQDGTFTYLYGNSLAFGTDIISQSFTSNGTYIVNTGGFVSVKVIALAFSSGIINIGWNATAANHNVKVYQPNPTNLQTTARINDAFGASITAFNNQIQSADFLNNTGVSGSIALLANTAKIANVTGTNLTNRKLLEITALVGTTVFYSFNSGLTGVANGTPIYGGQTKSITVGSNINVYIISTIGTNPVINEAS
jgi:hypothetical protein